MTHDDMGIDPLTTVVLIVIMIMVIISIANDSKTPRPPDNVYCNRAAVCITPPPTVQR